MAVDAVDAWGLGILVRPESVDDAFDEVADAVGGGGAVLCEDIVWGGGFFIAAYDALCGEYAAEVGVVVRAGGDDHEVALGRSGAPGWEGPDLIDCLDGDLSGELVEDGAEGKLRGVFGRLAHVFGWGPSLSARSASRAASRMSGLA